MRKLFLALIALIPVSHLPAQSRKIDSLKAAVQKAATDSSKANSLIALSSSLMYSDPKLAAEYATRALSLAQKTGQKKLVAACYHALANAQHFMGNYSASLEDNLTALKIREEINDTKNIARSDANVGMDYWDEGNYPKALEYLLAALAIDEKIQDEKGQSIDLSNLGVIYWRQGQHEKALEYYQRTLQLDRKLGNKRGEAIVTGNIGNVYANQGEVCVDAVKKVFLFDKALEYFLKALRVDEEMNDKSDMAMHIGNIGIVYFNKKDYTTARDYYRQALKLNEELSDKRGISLTECNLGELALRQKKYGEAKSWLNSALAIDLEIGSVEGQKNACQLLSTLDSINGNYTDAYEYYKKYIAARDSLTNEENTRKQTRLEMQYKFDKQHTADSLKVAAEKKVAAAQLESEHNKRYVLYGGLVLVMLFSGFMYNRFRITQKQKRIIEEQKLVVEEQKKTVEEKNKEILDSIHYAKRIQRSLLPNERYIEKKLKRLTDPS